MTDPDSLTDQRARRHRRLLAAGLGRSGPSSAAAGRRCTGSSQNPAGPRAGRPLPLLILVTAAMIALPLMLGTLRALRIL